jgi:hypothetical protein
LKQGRATVLRRSSVPPNGSDLPVIPVGLPDALVGLIVRRRECATGRLVGSQENRSDLRKTEPTHRRDRRVKLLARRISMIASLPDHRCPLALPSVRLAARNQGNPSRPKYAPIWLFSL